MKSGVKTSMVLALFSSSSFTPTRIEGRAAARWIDNQPATPLESVLSYCDVDLEYGMKVMAHLASTITTASDARNNNRTINDSYQHGMVQELLTMLQSLTMQCNNRQAKQFNKALDHFETCASIDLRVLWESAADAMVGTAIQCALGFMTMNDDDDGTVGDTAFFSERCLESFLGQNPVGDLLRSYILFPDRLPDCFWRLDEVLLPECTLEAWPIPLFGSTIKKLMCVLGNAVPHVESLAEEEARTWFECFQDLEEQHNGLAENVPCHDILDNCMEAGAMSLMLPKPFWGRPLSDKVLHDAVYYHDDERNMNMVHEYDDFVARCLPDRWEGWNYEMGAWKEEGSQTYCSSRATSTGKASSLTAKESVDASTSGTKSSTATARSTGGSYMGGLVTGIIAASVVWGFAVIKHRKGAERYTYGPPRREDGEERYKYVEMTQAQNELTLS